jgi:DNA processing protein
MVSQESTTLTLITLLELPNIGRKTVFNFLSNFEKEMPSNNFYKNENTDTELDSSFSILSRSDSLSKFEKKYDVGRIKVDFLNNIHNNFLEKFKIPESTWSTASEKALKIFEYSEMLDIKIISYFDKEFPLRLKNILDPPQILYYKGNIDFLSKNLLIAVVGTREPTEYGMKAAEKAGGILANCDIPLISGLAAGCDAHGQQGCINNGGKTAAVLAHGLDQVYPKQNEYLAYQILSENGCLISEYPPGLKPTRFSFVDRDRLQSGLSDGVLVIETGVKGGTMHTVDNCLKQKRLLGCISHPEDYLTLPQSAGNQMLISEKKAIPVNIDYFNDGIFTLKAYNDSILEFIKKIIKRNNVELPTDYEIIEKFHEFMFKRNYTIERNVDIIEIPDEIKQPKKKMVVKTKKPTKRTDKSQKSLIEAG